ncbi:MAG: tRNA (adenosine(37)-N6)-dimethylallyltransferase MiaA [Clostridia bacterium]|nr:tRNA (adenosine(37)-N6)-dimethylallyltransferase MiaA [Clostridia bacterium]
MKPVVLALVGPTGSGKTRTAIRICQALNAEIVSMDSMQVYRGMDIGTAKPTREELAAAPHHMIDVVEPDQMFTVSMYREMACEVMDGILARGKMPLLVGGTGLYLQAISYEMSLGENGADRSLRERLQQIAGEEDGPRRLHERLQRVDPASAEKLHPNDVRRVIRALEIYETSGRAKSEQTDEQRREGPYHVLVYGLSLPREQMYAKINARVDEMIRNGLVDEVKGLLDRGIEPRTEGGAMQAIGYKEIVSALRGEMTMERAVELIKQGSRRYAKRQWTWFRHDKRTKWFDWTAYESEDALIDALLRQIRTDIKAS